MCQLWDSFTDKGTQALYIESVQKFGRKVCLKQWDMHYESMFQRLELTSLSTSQVFKTNYNVQYHLTTLYIFPLATLYKIISPIPVVIFFKPFARTNYLYSSFVPSVISLWNNLPDSVKTSISVFKAHIPH